MLRWSQRKTFSLVNFLSVAAGFREFRQAAVERRRRHCAAPQSCRRAEVHRHHAAQEFRKVKQVSDSATVAAFVCAFLNLLSVWLQSCTGYLSTKHDKIAFSVLVDQFCSVMPWNTYPGSVLRLVSRHLAAVPLPASLFHLASFKFERFDVPALRPTFCSLCRPCKLKMMNIWLHWVCGLENMTNSTQT